MGFAKQKLRLLTMLLTTIFEHDLFRKRVKLIMGRVANTVMLQAAADATKVDQLHAAYDCLVGAVPLETILLLILGHPDIIAVATTEDGSSIPDEAIQSYLASLLPIAAPVIKVRRGAAY